MIEKLKRINSNLLELWLGIIFCGLVSQLAGMCFVQNRLLYTGALWIGIVLALFTAGHMYKNLDRALAPGVNTVKVATAFNLIRYAGIVIVFFIILVTGFFNPLVTFLGLLSLKAAAYLQPVTHKLCNRVLGR